MKVPILHDFELHKIAIQLVYKVAGQIMTGELEGKHKYRHILEVWKADP